MRTISRKSLLSATGFTLVDLLVTMAILGTIVGMAIPLMNDMADGMRLGQGAREVERELQTARLKAVTSNRPIRVRFNCPSAGFYRMVELIGSPSVPAPADADSQSDRCGTKYPYPAADRDPATLPNHDGPPRQLHSSLQFGAVKTLEFWPDGSVHDPSLNPMLPLSGTGTAITLTKGMKTKSVTVNGLGKIQIQ